MARCQLTTHANVCLQHLMAPRISQARDFGRVSISISHFCWRLNCCSSLTFVTRINFHVFLLPCACLHATFGQFHPARSRLGSCQLIAKGAASPMRIRECVFSNRFFFCPAFCGNHMTYLRYGSVRDHRLDAVPYGLHKLPFFVGMFTVSNTPIKSVLGSCFFWLAFCARFLRALIRPCEASLVSAEPSSTSAPCAAAKPFEEDRESLHQRGVHFNVHALTQFQGMQGMAEEQQSKPISENFRKRPNYDGSRRKLSRLVRERKSQLM